MARNMTKAELVSALADKTDLDKKSSGEALDALTDIITREVVAGGAVTLPGIGKISSRDRPARMVRNPATGAQIRKEADRAVKMTFSKAMKDAVNR